LSELKITILGTAAGVPTKERAHTAICLNYQGASSFTCLFDCGEGTQRQMLIAGIGINSLDRIFITHWHGDHCLGIPGLIDTMGFEERSQPLYIHAPEARKMKSRGGLLYPMGKFEVSGKNVPFKGNKISEIFSAPDFRVLSIPVKHSIPAVSYAFIENDRVSIDIEKAARFGFDEKDRMLGVIKREGKCVINGKRVTLDDVSNRTKGRKVVYSGDTEVCENLMKIAQGADLLIQDCTYLEAPVEKRHHCHASLPEIVKMAEGLGVKKIVLTHFSRKYGDIEAVRRIVGFRDGFEIAADLYSVTI